MKNDMETLKFFVQKPKNNRKSWVSSVFMRESTVSFKFMLNYTRIKQFYTDSIRFLLKTDILFLNSTNTNKFRQFNYDILCKPKGKNIKTKEVKTNENYTRFGNL